MNRHLLLRGDWLLDWFQVKLSGDQPQAIEWWMHPVVPIEAKLQPLSQEAAYKLFIAEKTGETTSLKEQLLPIVGQYVPAAGSDTNATVQLQVFYPLTDSDEVIFQSALVQPGDEILAVQTPGDAVDPSRSLTAMLHRRNDCKADFIHVYRAGSAVDLSLITDHEIRMTVSDEPNGSIRVRMTDNGLQILEGTYQ